MSYSQCALCQKPIQHAFRPFCSKRCQQVDLGRWLKGNYVVSNECCDHADTVFDPALNAIKED